jgi:hypothetical protein
MDFEQLGVSAVTVALLLWGLKLALAKINKHEDTIENLHDRNNETLITTLESQNQAISTLDRVMTYLKSGKDDD